MDLQKEVEKLQTRQDGMVSYLQLKILEEDWHGVADAAMDIREIVAEKKAYEKLRDEGKNGDGSHL